MDLPRAIILRAVEHDQQVPIEAAERVKAAIDVPKLLDGFGEYRMEQGRRGLSRFR
jgi:hypothetical protein